MKDIELCPCKSGKTYGECCGPVHAGARKAETAEELMRARYSAYAVEEIGFLKTSGGSDVQAEFDEKSSLEWARSAKWNGLEILATEKGGVGDDEGVVVTSESAQFAYASAVKPDGTKVFALFNYDPEETIRVKVGGETHEVAPYDVRFVER